MFRQFATAVLVSVTSIGAMAVPIGPITVQGTDVFTGPSFVVTGNFAATDSIFFTATGSVNLSGNEGGTGYRTNAAGVTTQPGNSLFGGGFTPGFGGAATNPPFGGSPFNSTWGSLLVSVDNFTTAQQVFLTDASNGLGNTVSGQQTVTRSALIGSLFAGGLSNGTVLQFRVSDSNNGDNGGSFLLTGEITAAPECSVESAPLILTFMFFLMASLSSRRRRVNQEWAF
jgi:hypothetical protein